MALHGAHLALFLAFALFPQKNSAQYSGQDACICLACFGWRFAQLYATYCTIQGEIYGQQPGVSVGLRSRLEAAGICPLGRFKRVPTPPPHTVSKQVANGNTCMLCDLQAYSSNEDA